MIWKKKAAYVASSSADPVAKLELAFEMYDADNSGSLDTAELRTVIYGMLDLLVGFNCRLVIKKINKNEELFNFQLGCWSTRT